MPSTVSGDFSKYPLSIQVTFPMVYGEACELRQSYDIYFHLFMDRKERTDVMSAKLGAVLGLFQELLQDEMFLSIARLTDKDSRRQKNLSPWAMLEAIPNATSPGFEAKAKDALAQIVKCSDNLRTHRHKRIAHFDLNISLSTLVLPEVTFAEVNDLINQIADFVNIFAWEFEQTTILFEASSTIEFTHTAEETSYKAVAYDFLEKEGTIPKGLWRKQIPN